MTLKDSIKADATGVFLKNDEFSETVTYKPRSGGARTIEAIVDRDPPAIYDAAGQVALPSAMIEVANSCTGGISSKEIDTGGDSVLLSLRFGEVPPRQFTIMQVVYHDEGMLRLALK